MVAKPLLKSGLRKTIGAGQNTCVWTEPWIPDRDARPPRPSDRVTYRHPKLLVNSFIRRDTRDWDTNLLIDYFHPEDIPLILKLRPSNTWSMDGYAWNYTKSRVCSVKSGYKRLQETKLCNAEVQIVQASITGLQSHVWSIPAPGKLRHFMWQTLTGCIATTERLAYRHMGTDRSCPRCGYPEETINHLLFECPPALKVWALSDNPPLPGYFPSIEQKIEHQSDLIAATPLGRSTWERHVQSEMPRSLASHASGNTETDLRAIFSQRHTKVAPAGSHLSQRRSHLAPRKLASIEDECWRKANLPEDGEEEDALPDPLASSTSPVDLQRPTCQIDASWIYNGTVSGLGWFYKDQIGVERFGLQGCRKSLSPLHAEVEGLIWAMICLQKLHYTVIHMETGCSDLVDMIANPTYWPAFTSKLVSFQFLKAGFSEFIIAHIPRTRNLRADSLTKEVRMSGVLFSYIDQIQPDRTSIRNV
ncbi:uncharacterized protein LOC130494942 [Raphanus sativus]|uniref:Uncharacterized protein LOC130494942 n=1 Tax=Raphanus sativus TaxID=3726 RepID=A0A9W3BRB9_RAPSA|nr:uncharacterized protein LOC130494942 [Raphanus sativus]